VCCFAARVGSVFSQGVCGGSRQATLQSDKEEEESLFDGLPNMLGWDDALDLDGLPGVVLPAAVVPASPFSNPWPAQTKRFKRGLEQMQVEYQSTPVLESTPNGPRIPRDFLDSRRTLSSSHVRSVAIIGGCHGNEAVGVALAQHFADRPELTARPSFAVTSLLANPAAVAANTRYTEVDMNRCFLVKELSDPVQYASVEHIRARELDEMLGPKLSTEPAAEFIIDLHCACTPLNNTQQSVSYVLHGDCCRVLLHRHHRQDGHRPDGRPERRFRTRGGRAPDAAGPRGGDRRMVKPSFFWGHITPVRHAVYPWIVTVIQRQTAVIEGGSMSHPQFRVRTEQ
jgi:hypothetical protein